ncbi:GNAT family acetyltransferase [Idiomarina fontislapidosi]|uniref:GNAT family N-acetyltransferase n=1 Tax=Idiomarina fontislapidosi TaxID=263723 RepID=A0A432YAR2_9GAMM|nr:GNAT family N-acetyltransferase [Idiomarina fontislapidosi]PYE35150.1 GNAT family acetyltransferase [Idiomarina fontislapidosi]RUO58044.1 GNAT family N-acetyltransferase [Idiomarina fontislapidosi]
MYDIKIRSYKPTDAAALRDIFFCTVRNINIRDYSQAQVEAWAPSDYDSQEWEHKMNKIAPYVAELNDDIAGYADLQQDGLIDHFFCHHKYQGKGLGGALMQHIIVNAQTRGLIKIYSHVSITARPFFERFGFIITTSKHVKVRGEELQNFIMEKPIK